MSSWVQLVESYVRASGPSTAREVADGTGLPLGFVRNALTELTPAPPEAKNPPPRAGRLVVVDGDRLDVGPEPPEPEPEGTPCPMTSDGGHVPSPNPLHSGDCAACGHKIGPHDPIRVPGW